MATELAIQTNDVDLVVSLESLKQKGQIYKMKFI